MMERNDSLYINVLDVPNILAAIDLAEEQLFVGIDYAMTKNVVGDQLDEESDGEVSLVGDVTPFGPQRKVDRMGSPNVYSASADLVERQKAKRLKSDSMPTKSITIDADREKEVILVSEENARSEVPVQTDHVNDVEFVGFKKSHGWNKSLQPGRSLLSKRPSNGEQPEFRTPAEHTLPQKSTQAERSSSEGGVSRQQNGDKPLVGAKLIDLPSETVPSVDPPKSSVARRATGTSGQKPIGTLFAKSKVHAPKPGNKPASKQSKGALHADSNAPESLPRPASSARTEATSDNFKTGSDLGLRPLVRLTPGSNSRAPLSSSDPTPAQQAQLQVPGVMYVPGAQVLGSALPNGYKSTLDGLRPVVTLDPRPKLPLQLRQTMADKLFQTFLDAGFCEMDCIVRSIITEQRLYANAIGRIDYRSASMMELARVRRETAAALATAAAEAEETAELMNME